MSCFAEAPIWPDRLSGHETHRARVLLCHQGQRSFRATRTSLSALFMGSSETDGLHLASARPLTALPLRLVT